MEPLPLVSPYPELACVLTTPLCVLATPIFAERFENPGFGGKWAGYNPDAQGASLYPNEVSSDFAFLPFGEPVATET